MNLPAAQCSFRETIAAQCYLQAMTVRSYFRAMTVIGRVRHLVARVHF